MTPRRRGTLELVLAAAALTCAALTWSQSHRAVAVAPIADGQPATVSVVYDPQLLLLTMLLAIVAGILAVVGTARIRRAPRAGHSPGAGVLPTRP
ncbi:MAG TPA: hypothetical protein VMS16_02920 [Mycobacterium sp.]|nr:hypothetical protein [Mycobacterium sp.]